MPVYRVEIEVAAELGDALAAEMKSRLASWLDVHPRRLGRRRVYHLDLNIDPSEAQQVAHALIDPVAEVGCVGMLDDPQADPPTFVTVGFRPGVTDTVGASVKRAAEDRLGRKLQGRAYSSTLWMVWGLQRSVLEEVAGRILYNPLIERIRVEATPRQLDLDVPRAGGDAAPVVQTVPLRSASDRELQELSKTGMLALSLSEMKAIAAHFAERGRDPTDAELECIAQTWSEHCKHKIFSAPIELTEADGSVRTVEEGLFRRYIRGATAAVAEAREKAQVDPDDASFLVSVFHDNAGVVRFTEADHLVYKVETHNSPSALDPYGGAMTGIVGVNRDSFGTGRGADLLTNVWGYCLGDPRYEGKIPAGLMHPRRIRDGVHHGVIEGGNQSGLPYSRGFELFDDRYMGKPLVFCGTVAVMPVQRAGHPTHDKPVSVGDRVVMVGGRIGKDGIHGATFSSVELDESAPVQAVQIGDPITQKMMFDLLTEAAEAGLMSGMTDNGAGGLSSSVGEMAELTGGARIDLARAPLKYPGLAPWEILISEAQERMTVAIPPEHLDAFLTLAQAREVEASVLGEFTDSGRFEVMYAQSTAVDLPLQFLHEGLPRTVLKARLAPPARAAVSADALEEWAATSSLPQRIADLMGRPNLASAVDRARQYDHEVKGLSVVKPLIGHRRDVPATATVLRARHHRSEGVVLGEGIHPYYSDLDARQMARACVDEAVRRCLCAGARLDRLSALDNFCWPDPVQSDRTPDGQHKLAQLVHCCEGLAEACEAYGVPLISGKDSMKNDAFLEGVKISIPPTLLVSVMGQLPDVSAALTLVPRSEGDELWLLGPTHDELGGSEVMRMGGFDTGEVPATDTSRNMQRYRAFVQLRDRGLIRSAHVCGRGGLAAALCHLVLASGRTIVVDLTPLLAVGSAFMALFSESTGRIVFTTAPKHAKEVAAGLRGLDAVRIGTVGAGAGTGGGGGGLVVSHGTQAPIELSEASLRAGYEAGLQGL